MNVDFLALGGTVWTAAGAVVVACTNTITPSHSTPAARREKKRKSLSLN